MRSFALAALCALTLVSCDTEKPDEFSLTVAVQDAAGRPAAGRQVALVYGTLDAARPAAYRPADSRMSPVYPTPWVRSARFVVSLDDAASVRVDLVDLNSVVVQVPFDGPLTAGSTSFVLNDEMASGGTLPAGVYRVRVTVGADVYTQTTVRSDALGDGSIARLLGVTATDGMLTTTDPAVAPALYSTVTVPLYDESGNDLGQFTYPESVRVVVLDDDGGVVGAAQTALQAGRNRVSVRLDRP